MATVVDVQCFLQCALLKRLNLL